MDDDTLSEDNFDWLLRELILTAERAKEQGLSPEEFLIGLRAYANQFEKDYSQAIE